MEPKQVTLGPEAHGMLHILPLIEGQKLKSHNMNKFDIFKMFLYKLKSVKDICKL